MIYYKYALNKSCSELNFLQKTHWTRVFISHHSGGRASESCNFWNVLMCLNKNVDSLYGGALQKISISDKNYSELNFLQNIYRTYIFISPRSGARGLQRLPFLKYNNILEWESWLSLGLNVAKSTDCIEKCFIQKLYKI